MGKIKRDRNKFHITKAGSGSDTKLTVETPKYSTSALPIIPINENIFAGVNIKLNQVKPLKFDKFKEIDEVPKIKKIQKSGKQITKKEKLQLRRDSLLKNIDLIQQAKKKAKARIQREKVPIIGDLMPLRDSLPSLEELMRIKPTELKTGIPTTTKTDSNTGNQSKNAVKREKIKKKKNEYKTRMNLFKQLLKDETYKSNPREAIATHIRLTMLDDADE